MWCRGFVALALVSVTLACSDDDSSAASAARRAKLAEGCLINTDCEAPLVCAFQRCHVECTSSRDCPAGLACRVADRPVNVCQLPDEQKECAYNSDCPGEQVCAVDARCRDQCQAGRDCLQGQVCASGTCAEPAELVGGALPRKTKPGDASDGQPCAYTSDCPGEQVCRGGLCAAECKADRDCSPGQRCSGVRCSAVGAGGQGGGGQGGAAGSEAGKGGQSGSAQAGQGGEAGAAGEAGAGGSAAGSAGSAGAAGQGGEGGAPQACLYSSDCQPPLVCRPQGVCGFECVADVDCEGAEGCCVEHRCVACGGSAGAAGSSGTSGQAGDGGAAGGPPPCLYSSDCTPPQVCLAGACRDQCKLDVDCPGGTTCQGGACKAPPGTPPGYGEACDLSSDCVQTPGQPPLRCGPSGRCVYECQGDADCDAALCCVEHQCVSGVACQGSSGAGGSAGSAGSGGAGGVSTQGKPCLDAVTCDDGVFCNGVERCYAGKCAPALLGPCDSQSACVQDECFEQEKTCGHTSLSDTGEDPDGDGHLDAGCQGGDDCDSAHADTYAGAPERCDGRDNDCNGLVDDHARGASGPLLKGSQPCQTGGGVPVGANTLMLCGMSASGNVSGGLYAEVLGPDGVAIKSPGNIFDLSGYSALLVRDAVSDGTSTALVVADYYPFNSPPLRRSLFFVDQDAKLRSHEQLSPSAAGSPDLVYTGSGFLLGLPVEQGGAVVGNAVLYSTSGALAGGPGLLPTADGKGSLGGDQRVRVAATKTTLGAFYVDGSDSKAKVSIFGASGSLLAGPVAVPAAADATVAALGGTQGGFVAVWSDGDGTWAVFVANDGTAGAPQTIDGSKVVDGQGGGDGDGAMFALFYGNGLRFGYARGALGAPFEQSSIFSTPTNSALLVTSPQSVSFGSMMGYPDPTLGVARAVRVGCAP